MRRNKRQKTGEKYIIQPAGINETHLDKLQFIVAHKMHFVFVSKTGIKCILFGHSLSVAVVAVFVVYLLLSGRIN